MSFILFKIQYFIFTFYYNETEKQYNCINNYTVFFAFTQHQSLF